MNGVANGVFIGEKMIDTTNSQWIDYSLNSTIVGWSVYTSQYIYYKVESKKVFVLFTISGTSNSGTTSFTLPYASVFPGSITIVSFGVNAGVANLFDAILPAESNVVTCLRWSAITTRASWTTSGVKTIQGQFIYEI
jgi:hypothetical protein